MAFVEQPLRQRIVLTKAELREATEVIVKNHYLHRGRTMAQLPYWINLDRERIGVMLFALPRLSVQYHGYHPMKLLELARLWIDPAVQGKTVVARNGSTHSSAIAGCAVASALRRIRSDWGIKYANLPKPMACVAWADLSRHRGTVYLATNFEYLGTSRGKPPGKWIRPVGGTHLDHPDYRSPKAAFLYRWHHPDREATQGRLFSLPNPVSGARAIPGQLPVTVRPK